MVALVTAIFFGQYAGADVLVQYSFGTDNGSDQSGETLAPTTLHAQATAPSITASAGVTVQGISDVDTGLGISNSHSSGPAAAFPVMAASGYSTSVASDRYFQFTLTPQPGYQFDLTNITFDVASGGSSARPYEVRYSFDNFATNSFAADGSAAATVSGNMAFRHITATLSDQIALTNTTTSTVTFRFFGATTATNLEIRYDNITVNGTVSPIPEPGTLALLAAGGLLLLRRRGTVIAQGTPNHGG